MSPVRFGIIGAGQIATTCVEALRGREDAAVVAAFDPNAGRLAELCAAAGAARAHVNAEALFADPAVDAVYIATPNAFHAPLAIQALQAGKHVLLEKPFALNLGEARAVAAAARAAGKALSLGMNQRFDGGAQRLRTLIAAGRLGDIHHAKAYWTRRIGIPRLGTWFGHKALSGGGVALDIGVHLLDLAMYLTGRFDPVAVSAATYGVFGHRGLGEGGWGKSERQPGLAFDVEDVATAFVRFAGGFTVSLDVTWACHTDEERRDVRVFGSEAGAGVFPLRLFRPEPGGGYGVVADPAAEPACPSGNRFHNFVNHLRHGEELCVTVPQALAVQATLDALYASAEQGREVAVAQG